MNNCAVICEYNPFHSGHMYQLERIREAADNTICVMSGNFTQSATPAFCDKFLRAECAIKGGADAVIELPTFYCTASAENFAAGGIKTVSGLRDLKYLAMGAVASADTIIRMAEIKFDCASKLDVAIKNLTHSGKSYNYASRSAILDEYYKKYTRADDVSGIFDDPNNILCIEYISALYRLLPNVEPLIIRRVGSSYNDCSLDKPFISASAIRKAFDNGKSSDIEKYIPFGFDSISDSYNLHAPDISAFKKAAVFAIKRCSAEDISKLRDCTDGLEYALSKAARASRYDAIINTPTLRRFGQKRIARILLCALLNIEKISAPELPPARLLSFGSKFDLSILPDNVMKRNAEIKSAKLSSNADKSIINIDERASALYNTLCGIDGGYYNESVVKVL